MAGKLAVAAQTAAAAATWLPAQCARLWAGQSPAVERAVAVLPGLAAPLAAQLGTYLRTNRARLRYDLFRQRGLLCGSGPVEPPIAPCSRCASNAAASVGPMTDSTASCACVPP